MMMRCLIFCVGFFLLSVRLNGQNAADSVSPAAIDTLQEKILDENADEKTYTPPPPTKEQIDYENADIKKHAFNENNRRELTKDLDYSVEERKKKEKQKTNSWLTADQLQGLIQLFKAIFWILAASLLLFLIYQIANNGSLLFRRARKVSSSDDAATIHIDEEDIQNNDFNALIRKALVQKNYILAVRLYYMAILKELDSKGDIKWEKEKTNSRYLSEMKTHKLFTPFKNCTQLFDTYFYGQRVLDETAFMNIQPEFQDLLTPLVNSLTG